MERLEGFTIAYEYSMNNEKVQNAELERDTLVQQQNAFEDEVKEKETEAKECEKKASEIQRRQRKTSTSEGFRPCTGRHS